jgi:hypothetical protein
MVFYRPTIEVMMLLEQWAEKWKIHDLAILDLLESIGLDSGRKVVDGISEASISNKIRLEASDRGCRLWRNNVGASVMADGSFIRYGLANDSSQLNKKIKSADLIGIRPIVIEPWMVGSTIGQFVSREVKRSNWRFTGTDREKAQAAWALLIISLGGDACFATGEGTL